MEIVARNITYVLNDTKEIILNDINMSLKSNKINSIIGKSGSGKTTLLNILSLLLVPTIGSVVIDNVSYNKYKDYKKINNTRKKIGFLPQDIDGKFVCKRVYDELEMNFRINKPDTKIGEYVKVLEMVGLNKDYLRKRISSLSLSDKKRVYLASILIYNPELIILDEPLNMINNSEKQEFINLMKLLKNKYNKTLLVVSNDINFIYNISDYIFVLDNGTLKIEGDKYNIFDTKEYKDLKLDIPNLLSFIHLAKDKKDIKLRYRDNINDLIKDIYRSVT